MGSRTSLSIFCWTILALLAAMASAATTFAELVPEEDLAFFLVADDHRRAIPSAIDQAPEDHWRRLIYTEAPGPRLRLDLIARDRSTADPSPDPELERRLIAALESTQRFVVEPKAPLPAPYRVEALRSPGATGGESLLLRLVDTTSGQVVQSIESMSTAADAGTINDNRAVYRLSRWFADRPWAATVMGVEADDRVMIDAGSRQGLGSGMKLLALSRDLPLIDPESGRLLGISRGVGCELLVAAVEATRATAVVVEGCSDLATGDRVELSP